MQREVDRIRGKLTEMSVLGEKAMKDCVKALADNCGLDHHGYDEGIDCVMTADTGLDCLERLDEGTQRFCGACRRVVERKLGGRQVTTQSMAGKVLAKLRKLRS